VVSLIEANKVPAKGAGGAAVAFAETKSDYTVFLHFLFEELLVLLLAAVHSSRFGRLTISSRNRYDFWFICSCNQRRYFSLSLQFKQLRQDAVFQSGGVRQYLADPFGVLACSLAGPPAAATAGVHVHGSG
jgi:hypothetical protein